MLVTICQIPKTAKSGFPFFFKHPVHHVKKKHAWIHSFRYGWFFHRTCLTPVSFCQHCFCSDNIDDHDESRQFLFVLWLPVRLIIWGFCRGWYYPLAQITVFQEALGNGISCMRALRATPTYLCIQHVVHTNIITPSPSDNSLFTLWKRSNTEGYFLRFLYFALLLPLSYNPYDRRLSHAH